MIPVDDSACSSGWWIQLCPRQLHLRRTRHRWTHARQIDSGDPVALLPRSIVSFDGRSPTSKRASRLWTAGHKSIRVSMPSFPKRVFKLKLPKARFHASVCFLVDVLSVSLLRVQFLGRPTLRRPFLELMTRLLSRPPLRLLPRLL